MRGDQLMESCVPTSRVGDTDVAIRSPRGRELPVKNTYTMTEKFNHIISAVNAWCLFRDGLAGSGFASTKLQTIAIQPLAIVLVQIRLQTHQ